MATPQAVSSEFCFDTAKSLNEEAAKIAAGETWSDQRFQKTKKSWGY
jgi:hypothetical protein